MINFDDVTKKSIKTNNPNWPQIPDHPYRILIHSLFNLISEQADIDKTYLYAKNPNEAKYQFFINKWESAGLKHFNYSEAFIEYSNDMDNTFKNIERKNPNNNRKILFPFHDTIADTLSN